MMLTDGDIIKSMSDQGISFVICVIFLIAIAGLIRIGLSWLKSKVTASDNSAKVTEYSVDESEITNKAFVIMQKALSEANLNRLNFMRFYYTAETPSQLVFMCGKMELLGKGALTLGGSLCHLSADSFPVFLALLKRDGMLLLEGSKRNPDLLKSVYTLHDAEQSNVLCVTVYDISRKAIGYIFAKKDEWSDETTKAVSESAAYLGILLSGVEGVL